jgi:glycosyltransferase involved in cell wall biosynthesis
MKVLMLNTFDEWGGAARAACRLNRGIRGLGIDSRLLVQFKDGKDADILAPDYPLARVVNGIRSHLDTLPVRFYPKRPIYNFTPAFMPGRLAGRVADLAPDILHLHWLAAGFCRLETLRKFKRPLVWTLHDSWAFTGGCHVPQDCLKYRENCGACPVLGSGRERDLSRWTWRRKQRAWRKLNLTVVAPSRWLADCARSSALFREVRLEVIPNGLDLTLFRPVDKRLAREGLHFPPDKKFILFGAMGSTSDPNKGFHLLLPALQKLANEGWRERAELVVFGAPKPASPPPFGMKARYLGRLRDSAALVQLYAAADVFVVPSLQENLPNTIMEAMACGTPCVGFDQGGMRDLIEHGRTGYLARPYLAEDLAAGIGGLLEDDAARREMAQRSRRKVTEEFALDKVSARYAALYGELLARP